MSCREYNRPSLPDFDYVVYAGDGAEDTFLIPYDYPFKDTVSAGSSTPYIKVYVDGSEVTYTLGSSTTVVLDDVPADGAVIEVFRQSSLAARLVEWSNNTPLTAANMEIFSKQSQFLDQELWSRMLGLACQVDELGQELPTPREYNFAATASQTAFSLNPETGLSDEVVLVFLNGVRQPATSYAVSESGGYSLLTLDTGVIEGTNVSVLVLDATLVAYTIPDGGVDTSQLADGAVTFDKIDFDAEGTNNQALMKRSGTWTASTILTTDVSGFDTQVRTNRLDQMAQPTASVDFNGQKLIDIGAPTDADNAATKEYVDDLVAGAVASMGTATLAVVSAGVNSSVTVTGLTFEPRMVRIYWINLSKGTSNPYDTEITFANAGTTETRRSLTIRHSDGSALTVGQQLVFTSDGFTYTVNYQNSSDYSGTFRWIATA